MILPYQHHSPVLGEGVFVAATATVIGQVQLGAGASIWYGSVLRGDVGKIWIGEHTNIQDLSVVHVTTNRFDTRVGARVTVGHGVILHGCTIADDVLIGMGAVVMDGAVIESGTMVAAGALVAPRTIIPAGMLALGSPARAVRSLRPQEVEQIHDGARTYRMLAATHLAADIPVRLC